MSESILTGVSVGLVILLGQWACPRLYQRLRWWRMRKKPRPLQGATLEGVAYIYRNLYRDVSGPGFQTITRADVNETPKHEDVIP